MSIKPALFQSGNGEAFRHHGSDIASSVALEVNGKIYAIDNDGKCWEYANESWAIVSAAIDTTSTLVQSFSADSNGNLYVSWATGTTNGKLWRSADSGANWTAVLLFPATDDYATRVTEADNGYLFTCAYSTSAGTKKAYRSPDNGETWSEITAAITAVVTVTTHFHAMIFDPIRKLLFVTHGDNGADSDIAVSDDYGDTFSAWTASHQATGMTFDSKYIYYTADVSDDRAIYRAAAGATLASVIASTPVKVFDPVADGGIADEATTGFAWWGDVDQYGQVFFPYGKGTGKAQLWCSSDQGGTWIDLIPDTSETVWGHPYCQKSDYASGEINSRYHNTNGSLNYLLQWYPFPHNSAFHVNEASGDDLGDGINTPWSKIKDYGIPSGSKIVLDADYTANYSPGSDGILIDENGFTFSGAETGTLAIDEDFEAASSLTASVTGAATVVQNDTNPYEGSQNALLTLPGGGAFQAKLQELNTFSGTIDDDDCWMDMRFSWNSASNPSATIRIMRILGSASISLDLDGALYVQLDNGAINMRQRAEDAVVMPKEQYVHIKMRSKISATVGEVDVWQDGKLVISAKGVNTKNAVPTHAQWDFFGNFAIGAYYDLCRASINFDPDKPLAVALGGSSQKKIPEGIYS